MANPEHLAILKQGVEEWNKWKGQHLELRPDLMRAKLSEAGLPGANLRGADQTSGENPPMAGKSPRRKDKVYTKGERQFSISR
jgi:hypothetical protein